MSERAKIVKINGPVVVGEPMSTFAMREMVQVGNKKLIGEVIAIQGDKGIVQVYEETEGLKRDEEIYATHAPLSVRLGPGMLSNMFDGIERPLNRIEAEHGAFIPEGIGLSNLDLEKKWHLKPIIKVGDVVTGGEIFGEVEETQIITHKVLIPPNVSGKVTWVAKEGDYNIVEAVVKVESESGIKEVAMSHEWPVRVPRPVREFKDANTLLVTGQRVLDVFFPIAKGGTVAIPGSFGTGKTMTQHQIAKYCDADIIVYIGCGERGNEMTEVLEDFPKLIDPYSEKPLMDRTILIANTSNMPVAAREASIYTGITMAEYFRDQGYNVAMMADSTSRWAEALREISGRLEEMPAEEGYPAYLPSRIAGFYERSGSAVTLSGKDGSVTTIGAVSPAGGDFSEPVTENTRRFVNTFLALDKDLAYSRHYPAIHWLDSYSGYVSSLSNYYDNRLEGNLPELRSKFLGILHEESKLQEIVMLVGEDVLPDKERFLLEIARITKVGFLQQNAFHKIDTFVPLEKQFEMLNTIDILYREGMSVLDLGVSISEVKNSSLISEIINMKYDITNEDYTPFTILNNKIREFYRGLRMQYSDTDEIEE
ncbi:V-type ATP synthase subunit A [Peptoniphilus indolicus]|uniref:V-type ATP synthase alpha chain n=2 Tax=Peptoniphilus indolicus TaxID=33030 RepID=G4D0Z5_9FIRM|nr:V-type ATP synthase subunit A [Peptoniphilus indolicus]EGY80805.1 V-type ATP synthase, subunit A [Peptoniphilus indolicus ATCC 29427]SUB74769.1 V-type ATP synthase alpha chain [Peptoniphilus indolicus]